MVSSIMRKKSYVKSKKAAPVLTTESPAFRRGGVRQGQREEGRRVKGFSKCSHKLEVVGLWQKCLSRI